jgi:predicted 3-demethylubiquinone-9 3-methyltransferase (glyoxalase superfamily)
VCHAETGGQPNEVLGQRQKLCIVELIKLQLSQTASCASQATETCDIDGTLRRSASANAPFSRRHLMTNKNTICLWYDGGALDAATFYAATFPDSAVGAVHHAPGDYPDGKQGNILTVEFTVAGIPCIGLNGGPHFKHNEAFSFQIATDDQAETDRLWNAIVGNGGQESECGWCKDRWGVSWQITPRVLVAAVTDPDPAVAKRAFEAMMTMKKIDIAAIEAARRGPPSQ